MKAAREAFEKLDVPLVHRKRLLRAIASLGATETVVRPDDSAPQTSTDAPERRQLTVMVCDFVVSTAMSLRLDCEDMSGVIAAHHRCCAMLITGGDRFVAKSKGVGVLAMSVTRTRTSTTRSTLCRRSRDDRRGAKAGGVCRRPAR